MNKTKLFQVPRPLNNPKLRLFCFPYAGGTTSTYMPWIGEMGHDVEVALIQPPGRGSRISEPPYNQMRELIDECLSYASYITSTPFVFFGHSLGSMVSYELCYQFQQLDYRLPELLIASGGRAPHLSRGKQPIYDLPQERFIKELHKLNGTPLEVLQNSELMELFTPLLRADFEIAETYKGIATQLSCPILIFNGEDDHDISGDKLTAWQDLTNKECSWVQFAGNHFFINQCSPQVIAHVRKNIISILAQLD